MTTPSPGSSGRAPTRCSMTCSRGPRRGRPRSSTLDYHPLNLLVAGNLVTGVLDWANARAGDQRADVARTRSILELTPVAPGLAGHVERAVRRAFAAGWRRGYRGSSGPLPEMAAFYAWGGAVMERDLAPRAGGSELPWVTTAHLDRIRTWTELWMRRGARPMETEGGRIANSKQTFSGAMSSCRPSIFPYGSRQTARSDVSRIRALTRWMKTPGLASALLRTHSRGYLELKWKSRLAEPLERTTCNPAPSRRALE